MCIVVKESYTWVYGGILNYNYLVGQFLEECREVQGFKTLASIFQKTWENRRTTWTLVARHVLKKTRLWAKMYFNSLGLHKSLCFFGEALGFDCPPLDLTFFSELTLLFFRLQNFLSTPGFLPRPQICTLMLSPNIFLNDS